MKRLTFSNVLAVMALVVSLAVACRPWVSENAESSAVRGILTTAATIARDHETVKVTAYNPRTGILAEWRLTGDSIDQFLRSNGGPAPKRESDWFLTKERSK